MQIGWYNEEVDLLNSICDQEMSNLVIILLVRLVPVVGGVHFIILKKLIAFLFYFFCYISGIKASRGRRPRKTYGPTGEEFHVEIWFPEPGQLQW